MAVSAAQVKELRERTGIGMLDCKRALVETDGDIEVAIENLRKSGQAKAAKKAGRTAAEGVVVTVVADDDKSGLILEVNSETDFIARDENFLSFANTIAVAALAAKETDAAAIATLTVDGSTVEETRLALIQKIGENVQIRRAVLVEAADGAVGSYVHGSKIGVLAALKGGSGELGKEVAMHIAAANPLVVNPDDVDASVLEKEKEIFTAQAKDSGKPDEIIAKMITGRISKFLKEVSLVEQPFVKDPDTTIGALVKKGGAEVVSFTRLEVGEGIEKEEVDFAAEVMAQVKG